MVFFKPSSASVTVQVIRLEIDTVITLQSNLTQFIAGEDVTLTGILRRADDAPFLPGAILPGLVVSLFRNNVFVSQQLTNGAGAFTFIVRENDPGTITYKAEFAGTEVAGLRLNGSRAFATVEIPGGVGGLIALGVALFLLTRK